MTKVRAELAAAAAKVANIRFSADDTAMSAAVTKLLNKVALLDKQMRSMELAADPAKMDAAIAKGAAKLSGLETKLRNLQMGADTGKIDAAIAREVTATAGLQRKLSGLQLTLNDAEAAYELKHLQGQAEQIRRALEKIPGDIEDTELKKKLDVIVGRINVLKSDARRIELAATTTGLFSQLSAAEDRLMRLRAEGAGIRLMNEAQIHEVQAEIAAVTSEVGMLRAEAERVRLGGLSMAEVTSLAAGIAGIDNEVTKLNTSLAGTAIGPPGRALGELRIRAEKLDAALAKAKIELAGEPAAEAKLAALELRGEKLKATLADLSISGDPVKLAAAAAAVAAMTAGLHSLTPAIAATEGAWAKLQGWAFKGGGFWGLGGAIGGIKVWHVALDAVIESIIAVTGAVIAGAAGVAALSESMHDVGVRIQAVRTVSAAMGADIPPLTGKFDALMEAMAPRSIEIFGGALGVINSQSANLQKILEPVVDLFDRWVAEIDIWVGKQGSFAGMIRSGTGYLAQFGQIVGHVTEAIHNLLTKDPGIAHYFLQFFVAATQVLDVISKLPGPLIAAALALHGVWLWGSVLGGMFVKMIGPIASLIGWISKFGIAAEAATDVGLLGGALGKAAAGSLNLVTGLAALITSPWTWAIAGAAAIGLLVYQMNQTDTGTKNLIADVQAQAAAMTASEAATTGLAVAIGELRGRMTDSGALLAAEGKNWGNLGTTLRSLGYDAKAFGTEWGRAVTGITSGNTLDGLKAAGRAVKDLFVPGGGKEQAIQDDVARLRGELNKLVGSYRTLYAETGSLVRHGYSVSQAFALMDLAGVKANDTFAVMHQKVQNLINGYQNITGTGGQLEASVNAVTFAALQQQEKVGQLNQGWDTFIKTIEGGEQGFNAFATQTEGLYQSLTTAGVKLSDSSGKVGMSLKLAADAAQGGKISMTGINTASLMARDTFLRTADAANTQMDSLSLLANAAGKGQDGVDMLAQANKDMVASMLPAAKSSQAMTDILYGLAQRGGYQGANSFKELSKWVGKTKDPMHDLDKITTTLTTDASDLTQDVKNLSIALGTNLNAAMAQAIITANGGQAIFTSFAEAVLKTGLFSRRTHDTALQLAQSLVNLTGSTADAHRQFLAFAQEALHLTRDQAEQLWKSVSNQLEPAMNEVRGAAVDARKAFADWAVSGLDVSTGRANVLWKEITARFGPDLAKLNLTARDSKAKFVDWAVNGLGLSRDKAAALWQELGREKLTEAGRKASTTMGDFEKMAGAIDVSRRNADNLFTALRNLPAHTSLQVSMRGDGNFSIKGSDGKSYSISPGGFLSPHAEGGFISGGIPGRDSVGALLMPGEVVVPTRMVQAGAVDHLRGKLPGFAAGGAVPPALLPVPGLYDRVPRLAGIEVTPHGAAGMRVPGFASGGAVPGTPAGTWGLTPDYVNKIYGSFTSAMAKSMEDYIRAGVNSANRAVAMLAGPAAGQSVLAYAERFKGKVPYVWGGSSPVTGWDCSGFVSFVYDKFGMNVGRPDAAGLQRWGKASGPVPGGMVFFGNPAHHVGFVVNGATMLSALGRQYGTIESSLAGNSGFEIPPKWAAAMASNPGGVGFAPGAPHSGSAAAAQAFARSILWAYGWGANQWPPLQALWNQESGWNAWAVNPSSGAYGIPQCYSTDMMVLTRRGWLKHDEVRVGDETVGYSQAAGRSEWTRITAVLHPGVHRVVRYGNSQAEFTTTPNHRWLMRDKRARATLPRESMREIQGRLTDSILILAKPHHAEDGLPITLEEAALLGWVAGDGWERKAYPKYGTGRHGGSPATFHIGQTKQENWPDIERALAGHGSVVRTRERTVHGELRLDREWRLSAPYARDLTERAGHPNTDHRAMILAMSSAQRRAWLDAMFLAEGSVDQREGHTVHRSISQNDGALAETIRLAVYLEGYRPSVYKRADKRYGTENLIIGFVKPTLHVGHPGFFYEDAGEQEVWCVTTELGSFTAEQNGHIHLTGNSLGHGHPYALGDYANQVRWGLAYISGRYGSPAAAWGHERAFNWYDKGGVLKPGMTLAVNATGHDETIIPAPPHEVLPRLQSGGVVAGHRFPPWPAPHGTQSLSDFWANAASDESTEKTYYAHVVKGFADSLAHARHGTWWYSNRSAIRGELATLAARQRAGEAAYAALGRPGTVPSAPALSHLIAAARAEARVTQDQALVHGHPALMIGVYQMLGQLAQTAGTGFPTAIRPFSMFDAPPLPKQGTSQYATLASIYGWYDRGGILPPGLTLAYNGTGRNEVVSPVPPGGVIGPGGMTPGEMQVISRLDRLIALTGAAPAAYSQALNGVAGSASSRGYYGSVR
jgi:hypothetical protein